MTEQRADVYARISDQIIAAIEAGTGEFRMPWQHDGSATTRPMNVLSGKRYRGANVLVLWAAAEKAGYGSGVWGTYRQWAARGGQVRRGPAQVRPGQGDRLRLNLRHFGVRSTAPLSEWMRERAALANVRILKAAN